MQTGQDPSDVKFDIVAHSMGGLIARYYLMYGDAGLPEDGSLPEVTWAGEKNVERLIMVGTPNGGSVKALDQLVNGLNLPTQANYAPAILGTLPSIYELLPRPRHGAVVDAADRKTPIDFYDPAVWEELGWGLADPKQERMRSYLMPDIADPARRRAVSVDHLKKCLARARQFHAAIDVPARPPKGVELYLFAGDAVPTRSVVYVERDTGRMTDADLAPGDGTVIRASTLMDERMGQEWSPVLESPIEFDDVMFLFTSHIGMTKDPAFTDNVLYRLLVEPRRSSAALLRHERQAGRD